MKTNAFLFFHNFLYLKKKLELLINCVILISAVKYLPYLVYFSYFSIKHMLWVLIRMPSVMRSDEYPQHMFLWRNKKKYQYLLVEKSALSGALC